MQFTRLEDAIQAELKTFTACTKWTCYMEKKICSPQLAISQSIILGSDSQHSYFLYKLVMFINTLDGYKSTTVPTVSIF